MDIQILSCLFRVISWLLIPNLWPVDVESDGQAVDHSGINLNVLDAFPVL